MPWEYILNIRLNNKIVYKKELDDNNSICISDECSLDKNNFNDETVYNIDVNINRG